MHAQLVSLVQARRQESKISTSFAAIVLKSSLHANLCVQKLINIFEILRSLVICIQFAAGKNIYK
jgi:hypothetical protein